MKKLNDNENNLLYSEQSSKLLDSFFDKETKEYYIPYNPNVFKGPLATWHKKGYTGKGVVVANLDTGMMTHHPLIKDKILKSKDFTGEGVEDFHGHGTLTTLIGAINAPDAKFLNVKILDCNNQGLEEDMIEGIEWAMQNGVDMINISAGFELSPDNKGFCEKIKKLQEKYDTPIIAAAGNNPNKQYIPACCEDVISIGAINFDGTRVLKTSSKAETYIYGEFIRVPLSKLRDYN